MRIVVGRAGRFNIRRCGTLIDRQVYPTILVGRAFPLGHSTSIIVPLVLLIRLFVVLIGSLDHCHGCSCLLLIHLPDDLVEAGLRVRAEVRSSSGRCGIQGVVLLLWTTHIA